MQAFRIDHHGPASEHHVVDVPRPGAGWDQVVVEIHAAGINPSDIVSMEGRFAGSVLPRTLGRDFAGRVVDGPPELKDKDVWGTGGDLGISRDGTDAEYLVVAKDAVAIRPSTLSAEQAAASALPFVTAWSAIVDRCGIKEGEWAVISGAAGAVGGAAVQIAAVLGAKVIALVKDGNEAGRLDPSRVAAVAHSDRNDLEEIVRTATGGRGADVGVNGVGAAIHPALLASLGVGGRIVVFSAAGGREITIDLLDFYHRNLTLYGLDTVKMPATVCAKVLTELGPYFENGALKPLTVAESFSLSKAPEAYQRLSAGKIVLVPDRLTDPSKSLSD